MFHIVSALLRVATILPIISIFARIGLWFLRKAGEMIGWTVAKDLVSEED